MIFCSGCSAEIPDGSVTCPACGMPCASTAPTLSDGPAVAGERCPPRLKSRPRFATGTLLASRYRIVTPLGRGGMGEVYRADDLKLNQAVALKLLPPERAADAAELARLRGEVRLARQISHPNVCRVFDLEEIDDQSFLCMEYIDGENLASLLRRIGRLPIDKALETAAQLAAGLAAIHDGGLLHRDLKPGNVMIDGRGRARITDFGLAITAGEPREDRGAGTLDYMAPEQRTRGEVSIKSDLYALGLVIYETLTGKPAWSAVRGRERPTLPDSVADRIDARIKTILAHCLDPDPDRRPASALQVAATLTGRDPLALAVADGLTLSPEAVAAAPQVGSLRPAAASTLLLATLACLGAVIALAGHLQPFRQIPSELPPDALAERARSLLREMGATSPPRDWASGFSFDRAYSRFLATDLSSTEVQRRLETGRPPLYAFWYRTSPDLLLPTELRVTPSDPPRKTPGEGYVELDLQGRLHHLEVVPAGSPGTEKPAAQPDWPPLLAAAGFDAAHLKAVPPLGVPPVFADSRAAWEAAYPGSALSLPVRIEAAAFQGTPVWLDISGPWSRYGDPQPGHEGAGTKMVQAFLLGFQLTALLTGFLLARRNLRLGRGDMQGAFRLAVFAFSTQMIIWLIGGKHALPQMITNLNRALSDSLEAGLFFWMFYLGFEPFVRRLWPERVVSWNRLLAGKLRDPLVGRDMLVGCLLGLGATLLSYVKELPKDHALKRPWPEALSGILQGPVQVLTDSLFAATAITLELMILLLALRILLRREALAVAILWALLTWGLAIPGPYTGLNLACSGLGAMLLLVAWVRFGPLAGTTAWVTSLLCHHFPLTLDTSVWYAASGLFAVLVIVSLALYGFATSVAGQRWFPQSGVLNE